MEGSILETVNSCLERIPVICCCKNHAKASLVLGLVLGALSLSPLPFFADCATCSAICVHYIVYAIFYTLICGILVFGAYKQNSTLILVWMVSACIHLVYEVYWLTVIAGIHLY